MPRVERFCSRAVEFRSTGGDGDGRTLEGYAAVFGSPAQISSFEGRFEEDIAPGAFAKTLSERTPVLQFDHGRDARTGSVPIGKIMEAREDNAGLFIKARMFDNATVEPIRQAIEGGAIDGMSFRFKVNRDEWRDGGGQPVRNSELGDLLHDAGDRGPIRRTVREVDLFEVGPVVFPAYQATTVGVRSLLADLDESERGRLLAELLGTPLPPPVGFREAEPVRQEYAGMAPGSRSAALRELSGVLLPTRANGDAKKPYGNVTYADPGYQRDGKKRYPVDSKDHVKAAWSYINQSGNASKYSSDQLARVKAKIKSAAKKFGVDISSD